MRVLVAVDKMRGTLTAPEAAAALTDAFRAQPGVQCTAIPLSDGGEGFLHAFAGERRTTKVRIADGRVLPVDWVLAGDVAVIESALAIGHRPDSALTPVSALAATTTGVGELIAAALDQGAQRIVVGLGGSTTTDGGLGALDVLADRLPLPSAVRLEIASDVTSRFQEAARRYGRQKGADDATVAILSQRLEDAADYLLQRFGRDVRVVDKTGAAGGLSGALWAAGGRLVSGFDVVAEHAGLDRLIHDADLVVTAEGRLDLTSLEGKVVGSVVARCQAAGVPCVVVAGQSEPSAVQQIGAAVIDLVARFGTGAALTRTAECLAEVPAILGA